MRRWIEGRSRLGRVDRDGGMEEEVKRGGREGARWRKVTIAVLCLNPAFFARSAAGVVVFFARAG